MHGIMRYWILAVLQILAVCASSNESGNVGVWRISPASLPLHLNSSLYQANKPDCECFNCALPKFTCGQYGECSDYDGQCKCPSGWAGVDCLTPQCGSLADGRERLPRSPDTECTCSEGWSGINCNGEPLTSLCNPAKPDVTPFSLCETDLACSAFPFGNYTEDEISKANMTCYKGGETVLQNHQMCNVTNPKILETLNGPLPQVTFSCDVESDSCLFQFWIGQKESFYCGLDTCKVTSEHKHDRDNVVYDCDHLKCSCIKDRMLCGEDGSVDIGEFLDEEIKGPAKFSCTSGRGCKFEEEAMNQLITDIFGDPYITLSCYGGECLPGSRVPGYVRPPKPDNSWMVALSAAAAGTIFILAFAGLWYVGRARPETYGAIKLPEAENAKLMADHVATSLQFEDISYKLGSHRILDNISGCVGSGEILAIMGASGAGKSTFLDILARKNKRGTVSGTMLVNGQTVGDTDFKNVVGFVDQEDTLMSTLTVYETVLYSALLRLPREMSYEAKKYRTLETLNELGLLGIKDSRIGSASRRSISGGEKRRVSIACELVTSPSILLLDEPTSGLDAYNALNVVESLVSLAREYNRTIVFTIHQPRSNIVSLFHRMIVLAEGKLIYSGLASQCHEYFESIGRPCPPGFNIADFLIDITMSSTGSEAEETSTPSSSAQQQNPEADEEAGLLTPRNGDATELRARRASGTSESSLKHKTSQILKSIKFGASQDVERTVTPNVEALAKSYCESKVAAANAAEIERAKHPTVGSSQQLSFEPSAIRGHRRATWRTQFSILSGRAFKNMYRDPALLAAHYITSIAVAAICGVLFRNVSNDIPGFQNRLGLFFFTLALFGFSCLSSLGLFANERILFIRERSNGYYSTFTYFASKVLFDIVPLRVVPPLVYGSVVYGLVGLVAEVATFWKFMLTLVLFNLTTASVVLTISVACASTSVGTLVGTLVMLYNLLFAGLLINVESVTPLLAWLHRASFFHAAFEALAVNELRTLQLVQNKYGVDINVPSAVILKLFGLQALAFWWPDIMTLAIFFGSFTALSFLLLQFYVKEQR